jgi:hypothetical protein
MRRDHVLAGMGTLLAGVALVAAPAASAANGPAFRDCSWFSPGTDPDFVQLSGAAIGPSGALTVTPAQTHLQLEASESADPGDSAGRDTFNSTVTSSSGSSQKVSGTGTGKVTLSIPLSGAAVGGSYTITWAATFDDGLHVCPSSATPLNTTPMPFLVTVVAPATTVTTPPASTPVKHPAKLTCHTVIRRVHGHRRRVKVCTKTKPKAKAKKSAVR